MIIYLYHRACCLRSKMWIIVPAMSGPSQLVKIADLHQAHPRIRAKDWRSPLVRRLLSNGHYHDGECQFGDSFRPPQAPSPSERSLALSCAGLKEDYDQMVNTYQ